jgi:hypothetical protein
MNYDESPITMEFTVEEHDLLNSILVHALDGMDLAIPCIYDLSEDSEILQRYQMLDKMRQRSYDLWAKRFDTDK